MTAEIDAALKQIESLTGRLARIMQVCDLLAQALTHAATPDLHRRAMDAYRKLFEDYPEPQPPPQVQR